MLQFAAGDCPVLKLVDTLSLQKGGKLGAPPSQVYAFGGKDLPAAGILNRGEAAPIYSR